MRFCPLLITFGAKTEAAELAPTTQQLYPIQNPSSFSSPFQRVLGCISPIYSPIANFQSLFPAFGDCEHRDYHCLMDSRWWYHLKRAGKSHVSQEMNSYNPSRFHQVQFYDAASNSRNKDDQNGVDLTLRLGLPHYDKPKEMKNGSTTTSIKCTPQYYSNMNVQNPHLQRQNQRAQHGAANRAYGRWVYATNQALWSPDNDIMARYKHPPGNVVGCYPINLSGYTAGNYHRPYEPTSILPPSVDSPGPSGEVQNQNELDARSSSSSGATRKRKSGQAHDGTVGFRHRKCAKCNSYDTPMWRKGPLGPKSLCNACGIKHRKNNPDPDRNKLGS